VNELVANAVRHGKPGTAPTITIVCDRVRGELTCTVTNTLAGPAALDRADAYSGIAIVKAMARLFDWRDLEWRVEAGALTVQWSMAVGTRRSGEAD
jgi:two-component sensor histidine kinase